MSNPEELGPDEIVADNHAYGYAHTTITGRCGKNVTAADIRERFYHPYFGGREAMVAGGKFSVIVHTD